MDKNRKFFFIFYHTQSLLLMGVSYFLLCTPLIKPSFSSSENKKNFYQSGIASYYSKKFHGRKTASGEIYDSSLYTAAHRTLPFGTKVKVTNISNGKFVIVKINDRGSFKGGRIIDVSKAAAKKLGMIRKGIVKVKIEIIKETN